MNQWIEQLCRIASKPERIILGAISGTSMDGLDLALCRITGGGPDGSLELLEYSEGEIPESMIHSLRSAAFHPETTVEQWVNLEVELSRIWGEIISSQLREWGWNPDSIDLIGSHGQTLFHRPDRSEGRHATLQLVDGDRLARQTSIPVVHDFRQAMIAAGNEGAPLAPLGEQLLYQSETDVRVLLNLGGIGNLTLLPPADRATPGRCPYSTDTGPANTLMDEAVRHLYPGKAFDREGALARSGRVIPELLDHFLSHPYFSEPYPKSTGQEQFHWKWVWQCLLDLSLDPDGRDLLATLTELTARTVPMAIPEEWRSRIDGVYTSGGGWKNRYLMERLEANCPEVRFCSAGELGIPPEAKEAVIFALLANERVAGPGWKVDEDRVVTPGKISLPA